MSAGRLLRFLLTLVIVLGALSFGLQAAGAAEDDAHRRGWEIYQLARKAFRGGGSPAAIKDYSFHLRTRLHTPQGIVEVASASFLVYPAFIRQEIETARGKIVIVFDGDHGWQLAGGSRSDLSADAVEQIRAEIARSNILIGPEPEPSLVRHLGRQEVAGRAADMIQIADVGGTLLRLFVDAETGDVVKHMFVGDTPQGLAQVEELFSDFREAGGYRWHHHREVLRNGKPALESTRSGIQVNTGLDQTRLLAPSSTY
jgi:hypothetical protein